MGQSISACEPCLENKLTSNGAFAMFYPRFLGTWVYAGDWDRNPFYVCNDCMGLRAFILFLRNSERSNEGHWTITDCHPNDVACGGSAHKLLISPDTECEGHCVHQLPKKGWSFCNGEITTGGICLGYARDDSIKFEC